MRESERGFTLLELTVTVAIAAVFAVLAVWMLGMRPAALRHAVDEFDSALDVAHALAATSGNGATMVFAPSATGFTLRVYAGRPTQSNAVTPTNTFEVVSNATVAERTLGAPPFALFFDSAGRATGMAAYPPIDARGSATFPAIAKQPPCPGTGVLLTFTSPQGATETRQLDCAGVAVGASGAPNPTPTPEVPRISPTALVAHWTSDRNGALKFRVAEFGYRHWYAKGDAACDAVAHFATPNAPSLQYAPPSDPNEAALPPPPPANTPYTYPDTSMNPNQPIAPFELWPIPGQPGSCTMAVVDDYGQALHASVQVMGDLTPDKTSLTFAAPNAPAQTIVFSKTWDSDALKLDAGGDCSRVITWSKGPIATPPLPGTTPATAQLVVAPQSAQSCVLMVGDQYGEPDVRIPIEVKNPKPFVTWPEQLVLGASNSRISYHPYAPTDYVALVNRLLGGGVADANATTTVGCYAGAFTGTGAPDPLTNAPASVQSWATANGIYTDSTGCFLNGPAGSGGVPISATTGNVGVIAYEPSGVSKAYVIQSAQNTCNGGTASEVGWLPLSAQGVQAMLKIQAGTSAGSCTVAVTDGVTTALSVDHGLTGVTAIQGTWKFNLTASGSCKPDIKTGGEICAGQVTIVALDSSGTAIPNCSGNQLLSGGSGGGSLGGGMNLPTPGNYTENGIPSDVPGWQNEMQTVYDQAAAAVNASAYPLYNSGWDAKSVWTGCPL